MMNKIKSIVFTTFPVMLCMAWTYAIPYLAQALILEQMLDENITLGIVASLICVLLAVVVAVITALVIKKIKPVLIGYGISSAILILFLLLMLVFGDKSNLLFYYAPFNEISIILYRVCACGTLSVSGFYIGTLVNRWLFVLLSIVYIVLIFALQIFVFKVIKKLKPKSGRLS